MSALASEVALTLDKKGFSLERLRDHEQLGKLVRNPKMGKILYKSVRKVSEAVSIRPGCTVLLFHGAFRLSCRVIAIEESSVKLDLLLKPKFWDDEIHGNSEAFWIFVEDVDGEVLLHHEYFVISRWVV